MSGAPLVGAPGAAPTARPIQADVETRNCETRLLSLVPVSGLGKASLGATLRRVLTQFPDGNVVTDVAVQADYRNYLGLLDRHCWTVRGDVAVAE